jgi:hypothetical protein
MPYPVKKAGDTQLSFNSTKPQLGSRSVHLRISLANIAVTKVGLQELGITQQSQ